MDTVELATPVEGVIPDRVTSAVELLISKAFARIADCPSGLVIMRSHNPAGLFTISKVNVIAVGPGTETLVPEIFVEPERLRITAGTGEVENPVPVTLILWVRGLELKLEVMEMEEMVGGGT